MPALTMMKGLPGSGKSTWAREQVKKSSGQTKRVSMDDLRSMLDEGQWSANNEKAVLEMRSVMTIGLLGMGHNVIVDATHLHPKHEPALRAIAESVGATFKVQDFTHVSVEACISHDLKRDASVGERVIRKMWKQFLYTAPEEAPEPARGIGPRAIIVDIDGTVAKMVSRGPHDYDKVGEDEPKVSVIRVVQEWVLDRLQHSHDWHLIFCSGRPDSCREDTEAWLKQHVLSGLGLRRAEWTLHMRPTFLEDGSDKKDHRNDAIVKKEIYDRFIKDRFDIDFVLDDRNRVVDMWREQGLLCLQVAPGDF